MADYPPGCTTEQRWQLEIAARLRRDDVEALLELYDQLAPMLFGYALALGHRRRHAVRALRQAFLEVWQAPILLSDPRVPPAIALAALVTQVLNQQPVRARPRMPTASNEAGK